MGYEEKLAAAKTFLSERKTSAKQSKPISRRAYEAGKVTRLTQSWRPSNVSINTDLIGGLENLRARSRSLYQNNEHAKKFAKMVVTNVVGPQGFGLQAKAEDIPGKLDDVANKAIEKAFAEWSQNGVCEITGRNGFVDVCRVVANTLPIDGEYLVRKIFGKAARNKFGFALQVMDASRLDSTYNISGGGTRNDIVMGVEVDAYRRPIAYHILTQPPGDSGRRERERIPAEEIYHGFLSEAAEQLRGVPWMSASILSLHHVGEFEQSALIAARKGANTLGFFVTPDGQAPGGGVGTASESGESASNDIDISVPGEYDTLPDGYDFRPYDSKYPDAMLDPFIKHYNRKIATGFNVAYHTLGNDLTDVNFSSIRSGTIDERDNWMILQSWFSNGLLSNIYNDWLKISLLNSAIVTATGAALPAAKLDKFRAHYWQGRRWQWVDPQKDINAAVTAIDNGLASPYQIAAQQGVDVEQVLDDIERFQKLVAKKNIKLGKDANSETVALPASQDQ